MMPDQIAQIADNKEGRFEIKKWIPVALWSWNITVDTCAICKSHIMEKCLECDGQAAIGQIQDCEQAFGICNHVYHNHCIQRWLKNKNTCPLDNSIWEEKPKVFAQQNP